MRNSYKTEIDADPSDNFALFLIRHINGRKEEPLLVAINQIGFATLEAKQLAVTITTDERNLCPAIKRPDVCDALFHIPRQDARVIADRAMLAKFALHLAIELIGVSDLGI